MALLWVSWCAGSCLSAEDFRVRYNVAGTLPLPAPTPQAIYPVSGANEVALQTGGQAKVMALALGYITQERSHRGMDGQARPLESTGRRRIDPAQRVVQRCIQTHYRIREIVHPEARSAGHLHAIGKDRPLRQANFGIQRQEQRQPVEKRRLARLEAAAGYMTPIGPMGLHGVSVRQYRDGESNLNFGSSRLQLTELGVFVTTKLPVMDAIVTLQFMVTTSSRNARHSNFSQLRIVKQF